MWKILILVILLILVAIGLTVFKSTSNKERPQLKSAATEQISVLEKPTEQPEPQINIPKTQIIATGLEVPWAIDFLPDNSLLITERKGKIRLIRNGQLLPQPIAEIDVKQTGESGLHGIALHPDFEKNKLIFVYYTYSGNGDNTLNRVSRFLFSNDKLIDEKIIVDKIPGAVFHDGGRIKFGPDRFLYITTGDATNPSFSQNKSSLAGKILRVTDEGKPAQGNPFGTLIYSLGHRNPQGITWDNNGNLWSTEHGRSGVQSGLDELNLIISGKNYGWDIIEGDETKKGLVTPVLHSGTDITWAPAGAAYFNNSIFFGGLRGQTLYQAILEGNSVKELRTHFVKEFGRIREVILGPDNLLYITTSNKDGRGNPSPDDDKIIKVDPKQL